MTIRSTRRFFIESLEDRTCPALTIRNLPGMLMITGTPTTDLTITGTGTLFQVKDGAANLGSYSISNLTMSLSYYKAAITIDLNDQSIGGNITFSRGLGNISPAPDSNPFSLLDGKVGGTISINGGSGNETVEIGDGTAANGVVVGGNVSITGRNGAIGDGDDVRLHGGSFVGGSLSVLGPRLQIGETGALGATVGGSVSVNAYTGNKELNFVINGTSVVGKDVSSTGSAVAIGLGDVVQVESTASIGGNFYSNLGDNLNLWLLDGTFNGNVSLQGGNGTDVGAFPVNSLSLGTTGMTVAGSFSFTSTGGSTGMTFSGTATVFGNMNLNCGNGDVDLGGGAYGGLFAGTVAGNLNITLGNGTNFATIGTPIGGKLTWRSGNGANSLTIGDGATAGSFYVDVVFGSADDTFVLNLGTATDSLSGRVDGGGRTTANTFTQTQGILSPLFVLSNFP